MKQISIIKNGTVTNQAQFASLEALNTWLDYHKEANSFGKPAVYEQIMSDDGTFESVMVTPAEEYEVVIEDLTAQIEQEKINAEAELFLKETDWYILREIDAGIQCPVEIKNLRQAARDKIVK